MLEKTNTPDEVLQKSYASSRSSRTIDTYQERCQEDIVYLNATGSVIMKEKGSPPLYVYELVVRNPQKKTPPYRLQPT